jgi:uncharacterized protein (DUF2147 family)
LKLESRNTQHIKDELMGTNKSVIQLAAFAAVLVSVNAAWAGSAPTGLWIDHTGRGGVEITKCGGRLCGHIAWLKDAKNSEGCGVQVIGDAKPMRNGTWDRGWIYDPEANSKYDVELKPLGSKKLRVMGYAGAKFLSETMIWKRAPEGLTKCSKAGSEKAAAAPAPDKALKTSRNVKKADTSANAPKEVKPASNEPEVKTTKNVGCKKFFPEVLMTLTVPCPETKADLKDELKTASVTPKVKTPAPAKTKNNRKGTLAKIAKALVDMSEGEGELPDEIKTILRRWALDR